MNFEETIEASRRLDRVLTRAVAETAMPETGGKKLAGEFTGLFASIRREVDAVREEVAAAGSELMTEVKAGREIAKTMRTEAASVRQSFGEMLGNAPPTTEEEKKSGA